MLKTFEYIYFNETFNTKEKNMSERKKLSYEFPQGRSFEY